MPRPGMIGRFSSAMRCRRQTTLAWISLLVMVMLWANMHLLSCVTKNSESLSTDIRLSSSTEELVSVRDPVQEPALLEVGSMKMTVDPSRALLYGRMRRNQSELTIGIPTVQRQGCVDYLEKTLYSLITHSNAHQRMSMVVIIFMVDRNETWVRIRSKQLAGKYPKLVQRGFLQIVHPHAQSIYPDFTKLKRTFNDTVARVAWRSKQNIDYAYLFSYSKNISRYYLQLEDDVIAANNYYDGIFSFIDSNSNSFWYCLEFTFLGFIGKLFRSSDLQELAEYILMFFDEQPGDLLLNALKHIKTQWKDIQKKESLFQHKGIVSSLTAKEQHLYDGRFKDTIGINQYSRKRFYHVNPSAMIDSKIETYSDYEPVYAYDLSDKYFWGVNPKQGDYFRITFEDPQNISRLFIDSGEVTKKSDMLHHARLLVSTAVEIGNPCQNLVNITNFVNGDVDTRKSNIALPVNIDCIMIEITANQSDWIIIREIAIFLPGEPEIEDTNKQANSPQTQGESKIVKWQTWKRHEKPQYLNPMFEKAIKNMNDQLKNQIQRNPQLHKDNHQMNPNKNLQNANVRQGTNVPPDQQNRKQQNAGVIIEQMKRKQNELKQKHVQSNGVPLQINNQNVLELWQHQVNLNKLNKMNDRSQNNVPVHKKLPPHIESLQRRLVRHQKQASDLLNKPQSV